MACPDTGQLRAYLDDALSPLQRAEVAAHLASCVTCQSSLSTLRLNADQVGRLLGPPASLADPTATFARLRSRIETQSPPVPRRNTVQTQYWSRPRPSWLGTLGAALAIICLVIFPPVRTAADELLQVFRVRQVVFFPVDPARIDQLEEMDVTPPSLFVEEPAVLNAPAPPRDVESAVEASQAVGFAVRAPTTLPEAPSERRITVRDRTILSFQVNIDAVRRVLEIAGIDDASVPDALGSEPITVDVGAWVAQRYAGQDWTIELYQGHSPDVTLPDGVDLAALGRTGLRMLGMSEAEAEAISAQIDWTSTLVVPIPPRVEEVRTVTINGRDGLLFGVSREGSQHWMLYWQEGERFYILEADGAISDEAVLAVANALQ